MVTQGYFIKIQFFKKYWNSISERIHLKWTVGSVFSCIEMLGHCFTSGGKELESVFGAAVCKIPGKEVLH